MCLHCVSLLYIQFCGSGSSVSITTDYRLDGPGSNPGGDEIFPPVQSCPGAHPASCKMGTRSFPGVKCGRGVLLTTHTRIVSWSWNRIELYLYPPSGPHRACNGITFTTAGLKVPQRFMKFLIYSFLHHLFWSSFLRSDASVLLRQPLLK
jgi:hypothetical protein